MNIIKSENIILKPPTMYEEVLNKKEEEQKWAMNLLKNKDFKELHQKMKQKMMSRLVVLRASDNIDEIKRVQGWLDCYDETFITLEEKANSTFKNKK